MGITIVKGNLVYATEDIITQQVNCQGVMGSGVGLSMKKTYPYMYTAYTMDCEQNKPKPGRFMFVTKHRSEQIFVNLYGQNYYGRDGCYTEIDKFEQACISMLEHFPNKSVAMPYGIGCGTGGEDWDKMYDLLCKLFKERELVLYKLK